MAETNNIATENTDNISAKGVDGTGVYDNTNTKDYSESIKSSYDNIGNDTASAIDSNVSTGETNLQNIQSAGEASLENAKTTAQQDYQSMIDTREAIEANNGNRDGIGHSQYGIAENTLGTELGNIQAQISKLKEDTARQLADLNAQGEYAKANATLTAATEKMRQLYTEMTKQSENTWQNYTYEMGNQRTDEQTQREQDATDKAYLQSLAMQFLQAGIVPGASFLEVLGLTEDEGKQLAKAYKTSSGGGGGRRSSGSSGSSGDPTPTITPKSYGTLTDVTNTVYGMIANGNYSAAYAYVGEAESKHNTTPIDGDYADSLRNTIANKGKNSAGYQSYYRKNYGS